MLTKEDYMKLPKERLAELLVERDLPVTHEDDIVEGHLWCEHCKYNNNCEEVLENCVNVILNGKVCHPKSAEL